MLRSQRERLVVAASLLVATVVLWAYLRYVGPLPADEATLRHVRGSAALRTSHLLQWFGNLGTPEVVVVSVPIILGLVYRALGGVATATVILASLGVGLNEIVRSTLGPTPASEANFGALVESYPSGHVVYATTVFGVLAWLTWTHGRHDIAVVLGGLVLAMGPARVLSGAHLYSDVLGGYLLGGGWLLLVTSVHRVVVSPPRPRVPLG